MGDTKMRTLPTILFLTMLGLVGIVSCGKSKSGGSVQSYSDSTQTSSAVISDTPSQKPDTTWYYNDNMAMVVPGYGSARLHIHQFEYRHQQSGDTSKTGVVEVLPVAEEVDNRQHYVLYDRDLDGIADSAIVTDDRGITKLLGRKQMSKTKEGQTLQGVYVYFSDQLPMYKFVQEMSGAMHGEHREPILIER